MTTQLQFTESLHLLKKRLEDGKNFSPTPFQWLVKGDISGIQDFIFSVKSEKASKTLKGRSFLCKRSAF